MKTLHLISKLFILFFWLRISMALFCDSFMWEYFHKEVGNCGQCDPCEKGKGKYNFEDFDTQIGTYGATICLPCVPCKRGTYSDRLSHTCSKCTKCSDLHMTEIRTCTNVADSVCRPIEGIEKSIWSNAFTKGRYSRHLMTPSLSENEERTPHKTIGIGNTVVALIFVCAIIIFHYLCRYIRRKCSKIRHGHRSRSGNAENLSLLPNKRKEEETELKNISSEMSKKENSRRIKVNVNWKSKLQRVVFGENCSITNL